jgi:GT2 family glycosyltransferase
MQSTISVLLTCHNRRELTLKCLDALAKCTLPFGVRLEIYLTDDGSRDNTVSAVLARYPYVRIIYGDGSLFWCRGMAAAQTAALASNPDFLLWLNDDTVLECAAIEILMAAYNSHLLAKGKAAIVVGATVAPDGVLSYSGLKAVSRVRRFHFIKVTPGQAPVECEAMNGNIVLIPRVVADEVGGLDVRYAHALGDIDYGLRARSRGYPVILAPGFVGLCTPNSSAGSMSDPSMTPLARLRLFVSRKGLPWKSWLVFTKSHAPWVWPIYFIFPYCKFVFVVLFRRSRRML